MTVTIYCILAICLAAVIGAVIGIFKKATGLSFWGLSVLLSVLIARLVATLTPTDSGAYSWLVFGITIGMAVLFTCIFALVQKSLAKQKEKAQEYSHLKNTDKLEELDAYILNAVDKKDKKQYKKLTKQRKKIKDSAGGWGVVDRIFGFVVGGTNWLIAVGIVMSVLLLFMQFSGISALSDNALVKELLESNGWVNVGAKFSLDIMLVSTVIIALKSGFNRGISHMLSFLIVLAMLGGFGYVSWAIASAAGCQGAVAGLQTGLLSALNSVNEGIAAGVAKIIFAAIIFLLLSVFVIITAIMLPKLIDKFRDSDTVYVLDGVIGAIISTAILLAVFFVLGGILYTLNDLSFMKSINSYAAQSALFNVFYQYNPFNWLFAGLPLRSWFGA